MTRLLRAPLLHFVVLGAALLAIRERVDPEPPPRPALVINSADIARLAEAWSEEHGAPPDAAARRRLVDAAIDEEVLYREAIARGFDRRDEAVRERLVRLGSFVGEETARDREALERDARRLGLTRSDLVADIGITLLHCWVAQGLNDGGVKSRNDRPRRPFGSPEGMPKRKLQT